MSNKTLGELGKSIMHSFKIEDFAENRNITLTEAKELLSKMSFAEYHRVLEASADIVPPSGNTIGPSGTTQSTATGSAKATWSGKGPINVGMTVGLKGPNGMPVPGEVSQVDAGARGVKVKNPTTGQDEWMNMDMLQTFQAADSGAPTNTAPGTQPPTQESEDNNQLARLRELAGIRENCSGGATGAGSIAGAAMPMGQVKKRQPAEEALTTEYTPKSSAKTIVGDTKPAQASGKLSADLAASGKVSASRINNGKKRR